MNIGISTGCLYPMLTEDCIQILLDLGFQNFEIFFNTFSELEWDYLQKLKYKLDTYGAKVRSIHPFTSSYESFLLFSGYERRFMDGVTLYEMYYRAAETLGADKVVLHGLKNDFAARFSNKEYFRRFDILQQRANDYGVTLLQENVNLYRSNSIEFVQEMIAEIPQSAAFVCDIKQVNLGGIEPLKMVKVMGSHLKHIHINDFQSIQEQGKVKDKCVLPGKGRFDFQTFFSTLKNIGFDNDIMIEVYRFSYHQPEELKIAKGYLEQILSSS